MLRGRRSLLNQNGVTADVTGSAVRIPRQATRFAARLSAPNNGGTSPTLDGVVEHSPTENGVFTELASFTQLTNETGNDAVQDVHVPFATKTPFPFVRFRGSLGGTSPDYDISCDFFYD